MRTIYVHRATEDLDEDMAAIRTEFDAFVDGTSGSRSAGLSEVDRILSA